MHIQRRGVRIIVTMTVNHQADIFENPDWEEAILGVSDNQVKHGE
jgi:hypothetical protein